MTPQETELVDDLFDRLAKLESLPRDPAAERLIAQGAQRAPHALYALVQTALLQDEALKRANARIEELQAELGGGEEPQQRQGGFLDSMRDALGLGEPRGSVPNVRAEGGGGPWRGPEPGAGYPPQQAGYPPQMPPGYAGGPAFGTGGSFLGNAASTAAGVLGGALLLNGIRSMFGQHSGGGHGSQAFGNVADDRGSPWSGSAADSQLARDAGIDHIGNRTATYADREQDRQQDLADDDREQDAQQDLADDDAQQDREQDLADDQDFASDDDGGNDDA
jgi:hypothetical protein